LSPKSQKTSTVVDCMDKLHALASAFRRAILSCDPKALPTRPLDFPRGTCGEATLLLAKYLEEQGCGRFNYVLGQRDNKSHAWLQRGDLIVDITADQFADQPASVIVTAESPWHRGFAGEIQHVADFTTYDKRTVTSLGNMYQVITKQIRTEHPVGDT
jgi:hypothetical protein